MNYPGFKIGKFSFQKRHLFIKLGKMMPTVNIYSKEVLRDDGILDFGLELEIILNLVQGSDFVPGTISAVSLLLPSAPRSLPNLFRN